MPCLAWNRTLVRDLRRAYTRLIKVYKPEHAPDEFRKLREAYETISQHLQWRERYGIHVESNTTEPEDEPSAANGTAGDKNDNSAESSGLPDAEEIDTHNGSTSTEDDTPAPRRVARTMVTDPLRDAWQLVLDGSPEQAFAELKKFYMQHGMTPAVAVRMYWLLVTFPELDPKIQPPSVLARGLLNDGWEVRWRFSIVASCSISRRK